MLFSSLEQLNAALNTVSNNQEAEAFWSQIQDRTMPLVYDDQVVFFYRGKAHSVIVDGDFGQIPAKRLPGSIIWAASVTLPPDARVEYQFLLNRRTHKLDPLNPNTEIGGLDEKSWVAMPEYIFPDYIKVEGNVPRGSLTKDLPVFSHKLGYDLMCRVYTPAGYGKLKHLPVIYITDGQDYLRFGHMQETLDNLIARAVIPPIMAVFIDPRHVATGKNLREEQFLSNTAYQDFVAEELVPTIDSAYRTDTSPQRRAILGASYGGAFAAALALRHHKTFHLYGMQSPSLWRTPEVLEGWKAVDMLPIRIFMNCGTLGDVIQDARSLRSVFEDKRIALTYCEAHEGHSYAQWRRLFSKMLQYLFT